MEVVRKIESFSKLTLAFKIVVQMWGERERARDRICSLVRERESERKESMERQRTFLCLENEK
jgi:hypothetical protein